MSAATNQRLLAPSTETTLLIWLLAALHPMKRSRVKELLRQGRVTVNGTPTTRHDFPLRPGDHILLTRAAPRDQSLEQAGVSILFEDDALIVLDKPSGLLTVATVAEKTDTAFARLHAHLTARGQGRPYVVHRLDRETSGLLLFARSEVVRDQLQANWTDVTKTYLAIVEGRPRQDEGTVENFLKEGRDLRVRSKPEGQGARCAVTHYRIIAESGPNALLEVRIETGRKHQIRVHLADLGCPVIGDSVYGFARKHCTRLGLHAHRLALFHPVTRNPLEIESPLPRELQRLIGAQE